VTVPRREDPRDLAALRTEWSRFRGQVLDAHTGLPTLSAVLDEVRRLLEERGSLVVLYVDLDLGARERGASAARERTRAFAAELSALPAEGVLEARDVTAVGGVGSDKFLLFLGQRAQGPRGPALAHAIASRLARRPGAAAPGDAGAHGFHHGHAVLERDPMLRTERSIHQAVDQAVLLSLRRRSEEEGRRVQGLDEIVRAREVVTLYQPILDLHTREAIGHEVFTRGPAGGPFEDPDFLFALAERTGRLLEVERMCRRRALESARRHLPAGARLFLNTWTRTLQDPDVAGAGFMELVRAHGFEPAEVVLEITERVAVEEAQPYHKVLRELKAEGFGIAVDEMGAGYASLQAIVEVEPDYLKFDLEHVRDFAQSRVHRILLETLVELAEKIGARVIAEGVERDEELEALRGLGVHLGQGRHLAPPVLVPLEDLTAA
jgi:EAL domain-containing protein (putative c-di-GMP-specific phosphodiesterase class I)